MAVVGDLLLAIDDYSSGFPRGISDDDHVLRTELEARGVQVRPQVWGGPVPRGAAVLIRSTWDYVDHPERFVAWLDHLDEQGAVVHNPTATIRWNMHKRYLTDLAEWGVAVVPTRVLERGSGVSLDDIAASTGWDDVVVKPAIAGTARLTIHQAREGRAATADHLARLLEAEDALVQPFVPDVTAEGEVSVVVIAGQPRHAVRKRVKAGDWRVQYEFGGTVEPIALDDELTDAARAALAALGAVPLFARVDLARLDGRLHVMELELIEPNLFLEFVPESAPHLADAVVAALAEASPTSP